MSNPTSTKISVKIAFCVETTNELSVLNQKEKKKKKEFEIKIQ